MVKAKKGEKKIFVLDTSVILFENRSLLNFDEHDVALPITVLEELDQFKKGNERALVKRVVEHQVLERKDGNLMGKEPF